MLGNLCSRNFNSKERFPGNRIGSTWGQVDLPMFRLPLLLVLVACLFAVDCRAAERPNVLFLICDDLNCDIGCYGHPQVKTPNIDRLAARGVRFERAYCQYPLCGPSRASFMTGLYPDQNLVKRNAIYIREHVPNVNTMSQMFRDAGYFATRIGKIYHYNVPKHIGTGGHDDPYSWNYTINPRGRDKDDEDKIFSLQPGSFGGTLSWLAADGTDAEQTDGIAATEAARMLDKHAKDGRNFFLAVGLYRPHTPYVAPEEVLPDVSAGRHRRAGGSRRLLGDPSGTGAKVDYPQEKSAESEARTSASSDSGLLRFDQLRRCASRSRPRCARCDQALPTTRSLCLRRTMVTTWANTGITKRRPCSRMQRESRW